jgi:hypothetical protein
MLCSTLPQIFRPPIGVLWKFWGRVEHSDACYPDLHFPVGVERGRKCKIESSTLPGRNVPTG